MGEGTVTLGKPFKDHAVLLVDAVVEADLPYFFLEPERRFPPLLGLLGKGFQKELPGSATDMPHDTLNGDTCLDGVAVETLEGFHLGRDGCSCENGVIPLLYLDISGVFIEEGLGPGH